MTSCLHSVKMKPFFVSSVCRIINIITISWINERMLSLKVKLWISSFNRVVVSFLSSYSFRWRQRLNKPAKLISYNDDGDDWRQLSGSGTRVTWSIIHLHFFKACLILSTVIDNPKHHYTSVRRPCKPVSQLSRNFHNGPPPLKHEHIILMKFSTFVWIRAP